MRTGVFVVHGMGQQSEESFDTTFLSELRPRLADRGVHADDVRVGRGYWADLLNDRERELLTQMARGGPLAFRGLRGFIVNALGDAVAYRRGTTDGENLYYAIHARILARLRDLRAALGEDAPLVVVAHSLGSVIMSDFAWDAQHPENGRAKGRDDFECMRTLAGMITFGSNIPLFTLALPRLVAIAPPRVSPALPAAVRAVARWTNYYDPDDVLGWPLRTLASPSSARPLEPGEYSYAQAVDADVPVNVGGILASWNPMAHGAYWDDADVLDPVADQIAAVALAARSAHPAPRPVG